MADEDKVLVLDIFNRFDLEIQSGRSGIKREIKVSDIKRPGIELAGFWKHFAPERVNLIGRTELSFLRGLDERILKERIEEYVDYNPVCIIVARGELIPDYLLERADQKGKLCSTN